MEKHCPNCLLAFTPRRKDKVYCSDRCQGAATQKRRVIEKAAARPTLTCPCCEKTFVRTRVGKKYCSPSCAVKFNQRSKSHPATPRTGAANVDDAARLLADGFFLGGLPEEIERIRKTISVASLEAALVDAIMADAVWPAGKPGRIAVVLALLKNPSLARVRWRHAHEQRRIPGVQRKPSGTLLRAGLVRIGGGR
jgi:hypothetical protein